MPKPVKEILEDPNFIALPISERRKVLSKVDPNFGALPEIEQNKVVNYAKKGGPIQADRGELVRSLEGATDPEAQFVSSMLRQGLSTEKAGAELRGVYDPGEKYIEPTLVGTGMLLAPEVAGPGLLARLLGSGAGYTMGKQVSGIATGEGPKPENIPMELLTGAGMEAGGLMSGKLLEKLFRVKNLSPQETANIAERVELGAETGVRLTPAEIRKSKPISLVEAQLEKVLGSSGTVQKFRTKQYQDVIRHAKSQLEELGGPLDALSAGQVTKETAQAERLAWKQAANQAYAVVDDLLPANTEIPATNLMKTAQGYLDNMSSLVSGKERFTLNKMSKEPAKSWKRLQNDRVQLNGLYREAKRAGNDAKKALYSSLKEALDNDIQTFADATGGAIKEQFDLANKIYATGAKTFKDKAIINVINQESPETIVRTFLKPNNISNIKKLKQAVGEEGMIPLKRTWLDRLFSQGEEQSFSAQKFRTSFYQYDEQTLKSFLTEQEYIGLKKLADISGIIQTAEKIAGNPSGTAQQMATWWTAWNFIRHPIAMLSAQVGAKRMAKAYFESPKFQRWLIYGTSLKPGTKAAVEWLAKATAIVTVDEMERLQEKKGKSTLK